MNASRQNICIIGAGSIGTALGDILAAKKNLKVTLLTIEHDVMKAVRDEHMNHKYFPGFGLSHFLDATTDPAVLGKSGIVFLAIPSVAAVDYILSNRHHLNESAVILNLAKGFSREGKTITGSLSGKLPNPLCAFKGPTFARELITRLPTAFTLGSGEPSHNNLIRNIFEETPVHLDFTTDVTGVEILSILKNIYAIAAGIVDAHFNSPNLRFLFLTKAFNEMRQVLLRFGGQEETMFRYCGYGDFGLTALNDLSRNRTLGLLIGKGFFTQNISEKVILEGKIAVNVFCNEISKQHPLDGEFPIISEMYRVFNEEYDVSGFVSRILNP